ncbi:hypothetical protein ACLEPN_22025 [Myxococcus sp. 1LA]
MADEKKKDDGNWGEKLAYFGGGVVVGAGLTVLAGHLSDGKVPVPPAMANALAPSDGKPKG